MSGRRLRVLRATQLACRSESGAFGQLVEASSASSFKCSEATRLWAVPRHGVATRDEGRGGFLEGSLSGESQGVGPCVQ